MGWEAATGLASAALSWGSAWLAARVLTRPVTRDVARSPVEVVFRLRDGARLRLRHRGLLLDLLPFPNPGAESGTASALRLAIPYHRVCLAQPGVLAGVDGRWALPNGSWTRLSEGPALRVVGGGQQWLLPLTDVVRVAEVIGERVRRLAERGGATAWGTVPEPTPPTESTEPVEPVEPSRLSELSGLSGLPGQAGPGQNPGRVRRVRAVHVSAAPLVAATLAAVGLVGTSVRYAVVDAAPAGLITAVAFAGVAVGGGVMLRRFHATRRRGEEDPRPADARPWGGYDPNRAPVAGWAAGENP